MKFIISAAITSAVFFLVLNVLGEPALANSYINRCIRDTRVAENSPVPVVGYDSYLGTAMAHKKQGQLIITAKIYFDVQRVGFSNREIVSMPKRIKSTNRAMIQFFKRHNITLDLSWHINSGANDRPKHDEELLVYLFADRGRMTQIQWGLNLYETTGRLAMWWTHELGHHLGLLDEYEGAVHKEYEGEPDSIMNDFFHPKTKFYPRHIRIMLKNLCG